MIGAIISLIISGLIVGALGRLAIPGPNPMSIGMTILVGLGGSLLGGLVSRLVFGTYGGFMFGLLGAILLVVLYRKYVQHRPITGPEAHRPPFRRY